MFKVAAVQPLRDYRLWLRFADGVEGEVDLSYLVGRGVFASWKRHKAFESVRIDSSGALTWDDGIDLCADALYLKLTGKTAEEVFPKLRAVDVDA